MRIKNTSRYPTAQVEQLVRFAAKGVGNSRVEVHVKDTNRSFAGRAYHVVAHNAIIKVAKNVDHLAVVRIGPRARFPFDFSYPGLRRAPIHD